MSKRRFEGIPGLVYFRVTAVYYPMEGVHTVSDLFHSTSEEGALQEIRDYLAHLEKIGKPYKAPKYPAVPSPALRDAPPSFIREEPGDDEPEVESQNEAGDSERTGDESSSNQRQTRPAVALKFTGSKWMNKQGKIERVPADMLGQRLNEGWVYGRK